MIDPEKMIKNERQYRITKSQADSFRESIKELDNSAVVMHPVQRRVQRDALQSQYDELLMQLEEYEALQSGQQRVIELHSFDEIPEALIKARIASGMSQKELADKLGLKEQQIQRYEATRFRSASLERLREIIDALGISMTEQIFLRGN